MKVWDWLMRLLWRKQEQPPEAVLARELARRIGERADQLNNHLKGYQRARDPFAAMMADLYNREQIDRIHKGPNR